ncbi:MAG: glycoside hydrolase family 15 protein [Ktedonobacterales bacterium]
MEDFKVAHLQTQVGKGHDPRYRPINQYGVIGDCRTAALIGPNGSLDWCCMPHFDSPAVFCRLLDADKGGFFRVSPQDPAHSTMSYLPGTNILETIFSNEHGRVRLVDFAPIRKRPQKAHILEELAAFFSRSPHGLAAGLEREIGNDVAAAHRVTRILTCLEGTVPVELLLKATFDFARQSPVVEEMASSHDWAGAVLTTPTRDRFLVLVVRIVHIPAAAQPPAIIVSSGQPELSLRTTLTSGEALAAHLNYARTQEEAELLLAELQQQSAASDLEETLAYWREWSASCKYTGTYQHAVTRSALALKLCTFEPTGAIIASPTTSLPESIGGERNWDYRYTWLRDSAFTLDALGRLGYVGEARDYFHFLHDLQIQRGADLRIMYGVRGEQGEELAEHELEHLEGYRGSRPVRVGNEAASQQQLDIYGEVLAAACRYVTNAGYKNHIRHGSPRDLRVFAAQVADYVEANWKKRDRGIWEVRSDPRAFVYSRVMCWLALESACLMADRHGHLLERKRWASAALQIREDVLRHGFDEQLNSFVQSYHSSTLDAANLRIALAEFLPWSDPRVPGTIAATKRWLGGPDGLIYRYCTVFPVAEPASIVAEPTAGVPVEEEQVGPAEDGLRGKEGTFLACAFWMVENLCYLGKVEEARERFEALLGHAGTLGLYSEELDPETGEQLGNYPQAFTHIGLINAAVTLQKAQEGILLV